MLICNDVNIPFWQGLWNLLQAPPPTPPPESINGIQNINCFHLQGDSQFVMKEEVSKDNLISFIMNHTLDKLNRSQRSSHDSKARTVTRHRYPVRASENCTHTDTESCVPELNSKSFLDFVMNPEKVKNLVNVCGTFL